VSETQRCSDGSKATPYPELVSFAIGALEHKAVFKHSLESVRGGVAHDLHNRGKILASNGDTIWILESGRERVMRG
jgi:hypothetical protein